MDLSLLHPFWAIGLPVAGSLPLGWWMARVLDPLQPRLLARRIHVRSDQPDQYCHSNPPLEHPRTPRYRPDSGNLHAAVLGGRRLTFFARTEAQA